MSILSDLDGLVLRDTNYPPLTDKGSELTYGELDAHAVKLYAAVQSIVSGINVTPYDAGTTYDMFDTDIRNRFAGYNGRIWQAIYNGSPSSFSDETPEEGIYWTQVTLAELLPNILPLASFATHLGNSNNACPTYCAKLEIASADVLQLNTTPLTIVAAQGAGTAIEVVSASVKIDFNSAAYATNTFIQLIVNGATTAQYGGGILNATVATTKKLPEISTTSATTTQLITNSALQVSTLTGNPTAGDSDITVYVTYRVITL